MKTFNNPSMCYMGPGGSPPTPYEPTPYATTQLIQSNIMSKNSGAGPLDFCDKRWKPQQPKPPELPSQLQFNVMEQNRLNKGEWLKQYNRIYNFRFIVWLWHFYISHVYFLKSIASASSDHYRGGEVSLPATIPYNQANEHSSAGSYHSSDRASNSTSGMMQAHTPPQQSRGWSVKLKPDC